VFLHGFEAFVFFRINHGRSGVRGQKIDRASGPPNVPWRARPLP
jgi:hypothetical protein